MKNKLIGNTTIDVLLIIVVAILSILTFSKGEKAHGILWSIVLIATIVRLILRYVKKT